VFAMPQENVAERIVHSDLHFIRINFNADIVP